MIRRAFLRAGLGSGAMPVGVIEADLANGSLVKIGIEDIPDANLVMPMWAVFRTDRPPGPAGGWLIERLKSNIAPRARLAKARRRRLSYVRRWNRGLRNASCNCTRKRRKSSTARTQIVRGSIPNGRLTFLVTHSDQEGLLIATANASLHSSRRSAKRLLRKCGCGSHFLLI